MTTQAPDEQPRRAAGVGQGERGDRIKRDLILLKWMAGVTVLLSLVNLALVLAIP